MLRRVVRVLRLGLLLVGIVLLVWLPASFFWTVFLSSPWPFDGVYLRSGQGALMIDLHEINPSGLTLGLWMEPADKYKLPPQPFGEARFWRNTRTYAGIASTEIQIPIWILALFAFLWPAATHIASRRARHERGFEVEPASPSEPPKVRPDL